MTMNEAFLECVMERLGDIEGITISKIFGGVGILSEGKMFAIVNGASLYFKTDDQLSRLYEEKGMKTFQPFNEKKVKMRYHEVPPDVLDDRETFRIWARWSMEIAGRKT